MRSSEIDRWSRARGCTIEEAERRFFLYAAICSIALDELLSDDLILRGSGAMWLTYGLVRAPAADLDFISRSIVADRSTDVQRDELAKRIHAALSRGLRRVVKDFDDRKDRLLKTVRVEVSPFYMPVGIKRQRLEARSDLAVQVAELEYLLAEKLIALIRQNEVGKQDPITRSVRHRLHAPSARIRNRSAEDRRVHQPWGRRGSR